MHQGISNTIVLGDSGRASTLEVNFPDCFGKSWCIEYDVVASAINVNVPGRFGTLRAAKIQLFRSTVTVLTNLEHPKSIFIFYFTVPMFHLLLEHSSEQVIEAHWTIFVPFDRFSTREILRRVKILSLLYVPLIMKLFLDNQLSILVIRPEHRMIFIAPVTGIAASHARNNGVF